MSSKLLMIGDWVQMKNSGRPHQITMYQELDGVLTMDFLFLPLTGNILEINGFQNMGRYLLLPTEHFVLQWSPYSHYLEVSIIGDTLKTKYAWFKCEYVHELQHLLKLFKVELIIKILNS